MVFTGQQRPPKTQLLNGLSDNEKDENSFELWSWTQSKGLNSLRLRSLLRILNETLRTPYEICNYFSLLCRRGQICFQSCPLADRGPAKNAFIVARFLPILLHWLKGWTKRDWRLKRSLLSGCILFIQDGGSKEDNPYLWEPHGLPPPELFFTT